MNLFLKANAMPKNLSIKNVSDHICDQLHRRAKKHHRSLQGELMAIIESSLIENEMLSPQALLAEVRASGLATPSESVQFLRRDRHAH